MINFLLTRQTLPLFVGGALLIHSSGMAMKRPLELSDKQLQNTTAVDLTQETQATKIRQIESINQIKYQGSEDNFFEGYNLCGLFALYNGLLMLEDAQRENIQPCTDVILFNDWLQVDEALIAAIKKNKDINKDDVMHDFSDVIIEDYLIQTNQQNICMITYNEFLNRAIKPNIIGHNAYPCVESFRQTQAPQVVLLLDSGHWIAILINKNETWVMDSLDNANQTQSPNVRAIDKFFRIEAIPTKEERKAMTNGVNAAVPSTKTITTDDD
jgi:hypothetical protein